MVNDKKLKFRKKPVVIEAYQTDVELDIETLEGTMHASVDDWIITGVNSEQYPCKPDVFLKTYDPVCYICEEDDDVCYCRWDAEPIDG